jgi:hypothetical protein
MINKTPKAIPRFIVAACLLSLTVAACNNSGKDKKVVTDTVKKMETVPPATKDTTRMDTGDTRPVKPAD